MNKLCLSFLFLAVTAAPSAYSMHNNSRFGKIGTIAAYVKHWGLQKLWAAGNYAFEHKTAAGITALGAGACYLGHKYNKTFRDNVSSKVISGGRTYVRNLSEGDTTTWLGTGAALGLAAAIYYREPLIRSTINPTFGMTPVEADRYTRLKKLENDLAGAKAKLKPIEDEYVRVEKHAGIRQEIVTRVEANYVHGPHENVVVNWQLPDKAKQPVIDKRDVARVELIEVATALDVARRDVATIKQAIAQVEAEAFVVVN